MPNRLADAPGATIPGKRLRPWLARLSFVLAFLAVAVVAAFAEWKSLVLRRKAEALGAEVFLMSGPEPVDVAAVARQPLRP
jgi:hypothetical protein